MAIAKTTFAHPPLVEVRAELRFLNELRVADDRSSFHRVIKQEFPFVVIPDQRELQFDLGDYSLYTENQAYRLEISMNYFRLVATKYTGYRDFRQMFLSALAIFARHYSITTFTSFTLIYKNRLSLPSGTPLDEYFTIKVSTPEALGVDLYAGKGMLIFQEIEGLILLEFDPQFTGKTVGDYELGLTFGIERQLVISNDKNDVAEVSDKAHNRLTDFFFAILHPSLLERLKQQ